MDLSIGETVLYVNEAVIDANRKTVIQEAVGHMPAEKWHGNRSERQIGKKAAPNILLKGNMLRAVCGFQGRLQACGVNI